MLANPRGTSLVEREGQDTLTPDHFSQFIDQGNGQYKIKNTNSGLLLGMDQESTSNGATSSSSRIAARQVTSGMSML